ncbi:gluconokinase [Methylobacterium gnaphalii]|nr:Gluconokinase [Methylobacterium gnaphalii]
MAVPMVLVVMGVSGSGKSTVAQLLAGQLSLPFADGDGFHTPENIARMRAGDPLDDASRRPWLARIAAWIDARLAEGQGGVVACSALRPAYRNDLVRGRPDVRIVYLQGSRALIADRLARRRAHFMPAALLDSQFADLEPPGAEECPITVGIEDEPNTIVAEILARLAFVKNP